MIRLAICDLGLQRRSLLAEIPVLALVAAFFMSMTRGAAGMPMVLIIIGSWAYALRAAYEDDKSDMWVFLRALPIPPAQVVGARFISTALVVLLFAVLVSCPLAFVSSPEARSWPWLMGIGIALGLVITGLFQIVYYRFGYRAASSWFRYIFLLFFIPALVPWARLREDPQVQRMAPRLAAALTWLVAHPAAAVVLAAGLILLLYLGAWSYASRAFARKELT